MRRAHPPSRHWKEPRLFRVPGPPTDREHRHRLSNQRFKTRPQCVNKLGKVLRDARKLALGNDAPPAIYTVHCLARREAPGSSELGHEARAVDELSLTLGGKRLRALLGANFLPDPSVVTTTFEVGTGLQLGWGATTSCVSELGSLLVPCLPSDFADAVLDGLCVASASSSLPSGTMHVDRAGHEEVDSSAKAVDLAASLLHSVITALVRKQDPLVAAQTTVSGW
jgi:hypothetical protein